MRGGGRGFTLLEILVALVVLAVVGGALLQLFHGGLRNVRTSADYTRAALLARSKLAELEAREYFAPAVEEGRFDERFQWGLWIADYLGPDGVRTPGAAKPLDADETGGAAEPALRLVQAALVVAWHDGDTEHRYALESVFLSRSAEAVADADAEATR